jgi:hypothetical protein
MTDPARFYIGQVSHQRFGRISHKLRYRIAYLLLDLDRLEEAGSQTPWLTVGSAGLMSFKPQDHGDGSTSDLAGWVRTLLSLQGVQQAAAKIELLTLPRMFGYVFNPLSVYFIRDDEGVLHHVLYEVGNTFGERHFYLCQADPKQGTIRHECDKAFYVSPFFDKSGQYKFTVEPPADRMTLSISYRADGAERMKALLSGEARPVTSRTALGLLARFPFMTLGVIIGIHWEALKLVLKGAKYHSHGPKAEVAGLSKSRPV